MQTNISLDSNLDEITAPGIHAPGSTLCLVFGAVAGDIPYSTLHYLRDLYPGGTVVGLSSAGAFTSARVTDSRAVVVILHFERTDIHTSVVEVKSSSHRFKDRLHSQLVAEGQVLMGQPDLQHVFMFSQRIAAFPALLDMLSPSRNRRVSVWGGASGAFSDHDRWLWVDGTLIESGVVAVSLLGRHIRTFSGMGDGCSPFGVPLEVTSVDGNKLLTMDGARALDMFSAFTTGAVTEEEFFRKALHYPFVATLPDGRRSVITIVGRDDLQGSLEFYGELVDGAVMHLGRFSYESLLRGIDSSLASMEKPPSQRGIMLTASCMARRMTTNPTFIRSEAHRLGSFEVNSAGFYGYSEFGVGNNGRWCQATQAVSTLFVTESMD